MANLERTLDVPERLGGADGRAFLKDVFVELVSFLEPHRNAEQPGIWSIASHE